MKNAEKGLATITKNLARQVSKEKISESDMAEALDRIIISDSLEQAFINCDIVIEAATENESLKIKIFKDLCPQLKEGALLACLGYGSARKIYGHAFYEPGSFNETC